MSSAKTAKAEPKPVKTAAIAIVSDFEVAPQAEVKVSPAEKYKELLAQAEELKAAAVADLKASISTQILELNSYGYSYRLADREPFVTSSFHTPRPRKTRTPSISGKGPSFRYDPNQHCAVCGINGHSTRAHNMSPGAFSPEDLAAKGWAPPTQSAAN